MGIVILKFGGKLLESAERIGKAADYIVALHEAGDQPVAVVSALGETTDRYMKLAHGVADKPDERELDMLLSVGEREAMSLLAMAVNARGKCKAISYTGSQVGIITDTQHTRARIVEVRAFRLKEALDRGEVPIIAGFQGVSTEKEITTLGRGGSDVTAVALSKALNADRCELVKDTGGIFTADPVVVEDARLLDNIDYGTLNRITEAGAKVVQTAAAKMAEQFKIPLKISGYDSPATTQVIESVDSLKELACLTLSRELDYCVAGGSEYSEREISFMADGEDGLICAWFGKQDSETNSAALLTAVGWFDTIRLYIIKLISDSLTKAGHKPIAFAVNNGKAAFLVDREGCDDAIRLVHSICIENDLIG